MRDAEDLGEADERELNELMAWMQGFIVDPSADDEVRRAEAPRAALTVRPTAQLDSYQRLLLYRDQYLVRMRDALRLDFPTLALYLGHERFSSLVKAFVETHPSRSFSLYRLGDNLPAFIPRWRETAPDRAFCAELARLERIVTQVSNAPPEPPIKADALDAVPWTETRVAPVAALQLATFLFPVNDFFQARLDGTAPPEVKRRPCWIAVFRMGYELARLDMKRHEYRGLSALVEGRPLQEASDAVGDDGAACVRRWCGLGMFSRLR